MAYTFGPGPALNPQNGELLPSASGSLFADIAGNVPVTDATVNGVPVSTVSSDGNAVIPQIVHETLSKLYWVSGSITIVLTSPEGSEEAAVAAQGAAEAAQAAAEAAQQAAENATTPTWGTLSGKPSTFPPVIGTGPNDAFPGNGNMDGRYFTKTQADARYAPIGSGGGGDATIEGIPSLIRVESGGTYPPRGTARADLQIVWIGTTPPESRTADSGADFINQPYALNRGTGQGPDRFEAIA